MNTALSVLIDSCPLLMQGACMTMQLWLIAGIISMCVGTILGILRSNQLRRDWLAKTLDFITFMLRGIPIYVQLLIAYFVVPEILGLDCSAVTTSTMALGLCSAAYVSQIVRGGINAIAIGQWEAAMVLGYSTLDTIRYIILPQMIRTVLPSWTGELDQLLKSTSIISTIGVLELTGAARNIIAREMNPLTMYLTIAVIYLAMSALLNGISMLLERRLCS